MERHPSGVPGALVLSQVKPGMTLFIYDKHDKLQARMEVNWVGMFYDDEPALRIEGVRGLHALYSHTTGGWYRTMPSLGLAASNLGLMPTRSGKWQELYCLNHQR